MLPNKKQVEEILRTHSLIKFKGVIKDIWVVGSYARNEQTERSDIDVLVRVVKRKMLSRDFELKYRVRIIKYFVKNNIKGVHDNLHPNFNGKRIDIYFTYTDRKESCIKLT